MAFEKMNLFGDADPKKQSQNKMVELIGEISAVFFESPDSLFKVLLVTVEEDDFDWSEEQIVVTGNIGDVQEGQKYQFNGKLIAHPKYGMQIQANQYRAFMPNTEDGVVTYLSGSQFKGIGTKTAEKIVEALGSDALNEIKKDPGVLNGLNLKEKQIDMIVSVLDQSNGLEDILIKLSNMGITGKIASSIVNKYHEDAINIIEENPYRLVEDIENIGFKRADAIAASLNIKPDFEKRIQAGILEAIKTWCNATGDTYILADMLLQEARKLLGTAVNAEAIADQVLQLGKDGKVVGEDGQIYLKWLYNAEVAISYNVKRMVGESNSNVKGIRQAIKAAEKNLNLKYDDTQNAAIELALSHPLTIITGGPGTGKTTIVKGLINSFAELNDISLGINEYTESKFPIQLAAPTGRAAKRLSQVTNVPAKTIHRLLGLNGNDDLQNDEIKQLEGDLLVIDEMSMVDTGLFSTLVNAINPDMQVVLVGDKDQLPSVGPGQIFNDLIKSGKIPTISLTKIYRQEQDSSIIQLAHDIQKGILPEDFTKNKKDKSFFLANANQIVDAIDQIAQKAVDKGISKNDIQVLAPMYRGSAGVDEINRHLQKVLNPPQTDKPKKIESGNQTFRIGDKVLQLVNSPENNIFNGDIGEITGIVMEKQGKGRAHLVVDYDGNEVTYAKTDLGQLTLAYCISIHKSQGSEFPVVIMPMVHQYYRMLQRNLLYTGLTRASNSIILLGEPDAYQRAVSNESSNRNTSLERRINPQVEVLAEKVNQIQVSEPVDQEQSTSEPVEVEQPKYLTTSMVQKEQVDPMIGMEGVTPYDFI
ncbi:SF1B family DNA helicase RecD2 [Pediococcus pentosaceus]|uniref:SF1B family DNA helicase RecD2 n=1 Tax=Pediococcus pentosaceus TaxID=1255 RepID=UPI001330B9B2|nr:ATP-dependent RecD-like DNA helicase [Pediococcus pentosaceus]KAF0468457.1 ATP-dependent RecD-like DNA helicase [Pediococcus pentosaceus]MCM6792746.1 ATP-dependent RecD-like DNA helicase [Pediococcus pentosaceus]MCM6810045.1 ATP-dependent RecD-like DNA helicase [Pediococcus pentosaceus]